MWFLWLFSRMLKPVSHSLSIYIDLINKEIQAAYYTENETRHGVFEDLKCRKHEQQASVLYISRVRIDNNH